MSTSLTVTSLAENEAIIERGIGTFMKVGEALARIRDDQQYVDAGYETFADYVTQRWGFERNWADKQIAAAKASTIVLAAGLPAPPNENVARQLVSVYNRAGDMDPATGEVKDAEKAASAVVSAWEAVVERNAAENAERPEAEKPAPITGTLVRQVATVPADGATTSTPNTSELLGRVGDLLRNAEKAMDRVKKARKPGERVRAQALEYSEAAAALAKRLTEYGSGSGGGE
jgi:hypothetical protein